MSASEASTAPATLVERYRILLDAARSLAGTRGERELYEAVFRETSRLLEVAGFYIALYDAGSDQATIVFYADRGKPRHVEITYRGSDSEVLRTGVPSLVEDRAASRHLLPVGEEEGELTRSSITAPLRHDGDLFGVISVQSYRPRAYTHDDLAILVGIADLATLALASSHRVAALERRREVAERLEEVARVLAASLDPEDVLINATDACLALTGGEGAVAWVVEEGDDVVARARASTGATPVSVGTEWRLDGPLGDRSSASGRVLVMGGGNEDTTLPGPLSAFLETGSGLAAPLLVRGSLGGLLWVGSRSPSSFGPDEVRALERLADQASLALENARLHTNLQALSLTDPLTGLANRRHLQIHMLREVAAARRGRAVAAVIFDLDDFKSHNDSLGHLAGDEILKAFGRILSSENRAMNLVARYGGDEFVSVLSDSRMEGARLYAARVRERVATDPVLAARGVTVSAGIASFEPDRMSTDEDLLAAADADLYRCKTGRDRPAHAGGPPAGSQSE